MHGRPSGYLYRLWRNQRIPPLCVILSHLSDDNYFAKRKGLVITLILDNTFSDLSNVL